MIQVTNLTKVIDECLILDKVNLHVKEGSIYGLVGPNGAGKTTIIKHLVGIYQQTEGSINILGDNPYDNNAVKEEMAYISDDLHFLPQASVLKMARFYSGLFKNWDWKRYEKIRELIQIDEHMKISKMSKGMKKQVAFWLAISHHPKVMILDEPVDGLDPLARRKIWTLLMQDVAMNQTTILISSHNLRELEDVCDTVGIMHDGKVLLEQELDSLKSSIIKVQVAFDQGLPETLKSQLHIINEETTGRVSTLILRGDATDIDTLITGYSPMFVDFLPLTLEEVFIYEIRGAGYDFEEFIL